MCPLQEITATLINMHFENQKTIKWTSKTTTKNPQKTIQTFTEKPHISSPSLLSHGGRRVFEFFIRDGDLDRTTRAGFRFRGDARHRETSVFSHVLTTILQALGWGTLRAVLLSRGIPRGCWGHSTPSTRRRRRRGIKGGR